MEEVISLRFFPLGLIPIVTIVQAMDILDSETVADEDMREELNGEAHWAPSAEANAPLIDKYKRYNEVLLQATQSDEEVRQKWLEWQEAIVRLTWDPVGDVVLVSTSKC